MLVHQVVSIRRCTISWQLTVIQHLAEKIVQIIFIKPFNSFEDHVKHFSNDEYIEARESGLLALAHGAGAGRREGVLDMVSLQPTKSWPLHIDSKVISTVMVTGRYSSPGPHNVSMFFYVTDRITGWMSTLRRGNTGGAEDREVGMELVVRWRENLQAVWNATKTKHINASPTSPPVNWKNCGRPLLGVAKGTNVANMLSRWQWGPSKWNLV